MKKLLLLLSFSAFSYADPNLAATQHCVAESFKVDPYAKGQLIDCLKNVDGTYEILVTRPVGEEYFRVHFQTGECRVSPWMIQNAIKLGRSIDETVGCQFIRGSARGAL